MRNIAISAAIAVMTAASANAATIVVNGSFEESYDGGEGLVSSHSGGDWLQYSAIPGWHVFGDNAFEIQTNDLGIIDAADGERYVELDAHGPNPNAGVRQSVFLDTGKYLLSFFYSPRVDKPQTSTNDIEFRVGTGGINGPSIVSGDVSGAPNTDYPHGEWTEVTAEFFVQVAGNYNLDFWAPTLNGGNTLGGFIDDVSIAPIPVPASALMLLAGVGAFGAARRKKA